MPVTYEQFAGSVLCLSRCIQKIQRTEMAKYGLKGAHAQCLLVMSRYPEGITAAQLSQISDKDKAAISRTIAELSQAGMVERQAKNGNAYRAPLILTDRGRQAAAEVDRLARLAVDQAGEGLTDENRRIFYATLDLIATNLIRISRDGILEE
ncbi:MAG: winged helix-turn-helix transcriptional regulator [Oscillospiraceae bacterium]|nr:winged helix-turn-helix transcriptional regulator [Oscillospiraceae bacterium]